MDAAHRLQFEPTPNGQMLRLPRRRLGKGVLVLLFTTAFGLLFAGLPGYFLGSEAWRTLRDDGAMRWATLLPALFALPFVILGLGVALGPWLALLARSTIRIEADALSVRDGFGPLGWTRSRPLDGLKGFTIDVGTTRTNHGPAEPMNHFATLTADYGGDARPFVLAVGHPRATVQELAELLGDKLGTRGQLGHERELTVTESVASLPPDDEAPIDPLDLIPPQPEPSTITAQEHAQGVTYYVAARGVWKGSRGLMIFALLWNAFIAVFIGAAMSSDKGFTWEGTDDPVPWFILLPFLGVFAAVGVGVLLWAINLGIRRAVLDVTRTADGPSLLIAQESLRGKKVFDLPPGSVTRIAVGPSGVEVNDQPVNHLKITVSDGHAASLPRRGNPLGLFSEREDEELRWLAARLRHDLGLAKSDRV